MEKNGNSSCLQNDTNLCDMQKLRLFEDETTLSEVVEFSSYLFDTIRSAVTRYDEQKANGVKSNCSVLVGILVLCVEMKVYGTSGLALYHSCVTNKRQQRGHVLLLSS